MLRDAEPERHGGRAPLLLQQYSLAPATKGCNAQGYTGYFGNRAGAVTGMPPRGSLAVFYPGFGRDLLPGQPDALKGRLLEPRTDRPVRLFVISGLGAMRRFNLVLLAVAVTVLCLMLRGTDWPGLMGCFRRGRRYWPLLLVPYGMTSYLWAVSWGFLLVDKANRPSSCRLFLLRLGGESLNMLTPTASLGGEPFKALSLQACGVAWQEATASLVVHKALMVVSLVIYIFLGLAMIPMVLPNFSPRLAVILSLGALLLAGAAAVFVVLQRRNPCCSLLGVLRRFGICPAFLGSKEAEFATLDKTLADFYREHAGSGLVALFVFFAGWLLQAVEAYLIFWLLGHPVSFGLALCLDALSQLIAGLGFMIPASLGVQDSGNILLSLGFRLGSTLGAGFSIARRFREAFWLLLGLLVVVREKKPVPAQSEFP